MDKWWVSVQDISEGESETHGFTGNGKINLQEGRICNVCVAKGCLNSGHPRNVVGSYFYIAATNTKTCHCHVFFIDLAWFYETK